MKTLITFLIVLFLTYEFIEHVVLPLLGSLTSKKKKSAFGPERLLGETGEVKEWRDKEGYVFVDGELWKGVSEAPLKIGDKIVVQKMSGLTVTVFPLLPKV